MTQDNEAQIVNTQIKLQSEKALAGELEEQRTAVLARLKQVEEEKNRSEEELSRITTMLSEQSKLEKAYGIEGHSTQTANQLASDHKDFKYVYMGDELKAKDKDQLDLLGIQDAQDEKGTGWYKLKILSREEMIGERSSGQMMKEIEKLILECGDLASHLEKSNDMLNIYKDMESDKRKAEKLDLDILDEQIKEERDLIEELSMLLKQKMASGEENRYVDAIEYDDNADMFSVSEMSPTDSNNYFDLYLDYVEFDKYQVEELLQKKRITDNSTAPKVLFMIEFYNFETVTSQVFQEFVFRPDFQASFSIPVDRQFLSYCMNESVVIEAYSIIGNERVKLGQSTLPLAELMQRNAQCFMRNRNLSALIRKRQEINNQLLGRPIGQLSVAYRMRRPCGATAKLYMEDIAGKQFTSPATNTKKMIFRIIRVLGLREELPIFVSYTLFDGVAYYTNTVRGKEPAINFSNAHDMVMTETIKNKIANEPIEVVVFDDSKPANDSDNSDIIGFGTLNLSNLLINKPVDETIVVHNPSTNTSAYVQILVYFYESQDQEYYDQMKTHNEMEDSMVGQTHKDFFMTSMINQRESRKLLREFADYLKSKEISPWTAFKMIDGSSFE